MNISVRSDSSVQIGSGHVMRCLTLADALREKGATISFVCREFPGNLCRLIEKKGYWVHRLPYRKGDSSYNISSDIDAKETEAILKTEADVRWLIVDHYALDRLWEIRMRPLVNKIMVIDDLADRHHDCDVLLDQNLYQDKDTRYNGLVPAQCKKLLGTKFALLLPEFLEARKNLRLHDGGVKRILVFFGGSDPTNETTKTLEAIKLLNRPDIAIDVVLGEAAPHKSTVKEICSSLPNVIFHCQVNNMAQLMTNADLAIGASGSATWERCCIGLPGIVVVVAQNQTKIAETLHAKGLVVNLGWHETVSEKDMYLALNRLINDADTREFMSASGKELIDGEGVKRVSEFLVQPGYGNETAELSLRSVEAADVEVLYAWRNDPIVRANSFNQAPIDFDDHKRWFNTKLEDNKMSMYMAYLGTQKIGVIRFEKNGETAKVNVMLNPDFMYKGLGSRVIKMGSERFLKERKEVRRIIAEIKKENAASRKVFQRAGFKEGHVSYVLETRSDHEKKEG